MRPFLVCIHDATPAYARETRVMIRDLAPLVGRRLSFGVVPNWYGEWPLAAHPDYCRLVQESSEELLLHGYFHRRQRGWGPTTLLAEGCDEMNGLDREETRRTLERGQRVFTEVFGEPARGFLAPGWQLGHVRAENVNALGLEHVARLFLARVSGGPKRSAGDLDLGLWSLGLARARRPWDRVGCFSRWIVESLPWRFTREICERGFWPKILRLTEELLDAGYEPSTIGGFARGE